MPTLPDIGAIIDGLQQRFLQTSTGNVQEVTLVDPTSGNTYAAAGTGSSSAVTIADGGAVTIGTTTDASTATTVIGRLQKLIALLPTALSGAGNLRTAISEALPAGTNTIGSVKLTDGTNTAPTLDVAGRAGFVKVTDGTNSLPTLDAVGRAGFVKLTDGTNVAPSMDAAGRAAFVKLTDGTNTAPTMDAVGRPGFQKITDGTNTLPTMDAVGRAGFVKVTDGTNTMPTMDAAARSGYVESNHYGTPTAGTNVSVGTGSTSVLGANASRKFLALSNDSTATIYVDLSGGTAASGKGVRLNANGGAVVLDRYVPTSAITAIAASASSNLAVQEG
jgi:hypothetical protein